MPNTRFCFLLLSFLLLNCLVVTAQIRKNDEIKRIDLYCEKLDAHSKANVKPHLVFADVSQNAKPKWRKFTSVSALEKFRETTETFTIANNWMKNGKIVLTVFTLFSESGDWAKYVRSYFRPDGSLAKVETDYRTFHGDFRYEERLYFDAHGSLLAKHTGFKDLDMKKIAMPGKSYLKDNSPMMNAADYYKSTSNLPYAHLLGKK